MKISTIVGARPQFIKAAAVSREISIHRQIKETIIHTGQHYDFNMSDVFFKEMNIPTPHFNLGINSLSHGAMTGQMLERIEQALIQNKPDCVLVYGDTNSTLAGALAASKMHIQVAHVEAGLRSFNMSMPEEINRTLTDRISNILFCPTDNAVNNLKKEGFGFFSCDIVKSGDVMQDASLFYADQSSHKSKIIKKTNLNKFILCTVHREENVNDTKKIKSIFEALSAVSNDINVVIPLHPRTKKVLCNRSVDTKGLLVMEPVGYFDMIELLKFCSMVITDSGGLQKEAFFFNKPCVTLREETEWVELVEKGYNVLAGSNKEKIIESYLRMRNKSIPSDTSLYGGGKASSNIVNMLLKKIR